jgi:hypothetical protein
VVDPAQGDKLVGYLSRAGVMEAHFKKLEEEHHAEPGWVM